MCKFDFKFDFSGVVYRRSQLLRCTPHVHLWFIFDRPGRFCLPNHVRFSPKTTELSLKEFVAGFPCLVFRDKILTFVTVSITSSPILFTEGPFARVLSKVERERSPRAALRPAPGRLRASFTPVLRPVREVQSLD